jgi:hypothetical protein
MRREPGYHIELEAGLVAPLKTLIAVGRIGVSPDASLGWE